MSGLSALLTISLVIVLLFGSVSLYMYTRIQQAEHKISLLESILLDLKLTTEVKGFSQSPASEETSENAETTQSEYVPFIEEYNDDSDEQVSESTDLENKTSSTAQETTSELEEYTAVVNSALNNEVVEVSEKLDHHLNESYSSESYDNMTLKQLQTLAKKKNISGASTMKRSHVLEALKTSEHKINNVEPGSNNTGDNSLFNNSAAVNFSSE